MNGKTSLFSLIARLLLLGNFNQRFIDKLTCIPYTAEHLWDTCSFYKDYANLHLKPIMSYIKRWIIVPNISEHTQTLLVHFKPLVKRDPFKGALTHAP